MPLTAWTKSGVILVDIARDLAGWRAGTSGFERTACTILGARPIGQNAALIDLARAGEALSARTDIEITFTVVREGGFGVLALGLAGLVPDGDMRRDAAIHEALECLPRSIGGVGGEPLRWSRCRARQRGST